MNDQLINHSIRNFNVTIFIIIFLFTGVCVKAEKVKNSNVKIKRVALFKNGLGHFTSSAKIPKGKSNIIIGQLPVPSQGTFWVGYSTNLKVRSLITKLETVEKEIPIQNITELLQANIGKKVLINAEKESKNLSVFGKILKVLPEKQPIEPANPYFMDVRSLSYANRYRPYSYKKSTLVVIDSGKGIYTLNSDTISNVKFITNNIVTTTTEKKQQPCIRIELSEKSPANEEISITYLARGITWSPSYLIDISDPEIAKLNAKAIVINEVVDMEKVHIDLITGFPNTQFGEVNSPVGMSQKLENFLNALVNGRSERNRRYMMRQQAMLSNAPRYDNFERVPVPSYSTAHEGTTSEDLFFYPVENISLACGETAYLPLFTAKVPYKHIYIWKIPDILDDNERYRRNNSNNKKQFAPEVWHSCRLLNNMKMPWTTAAAEFIKDGQFTGQDVCYYTAPGAETTIRINRAMNVIADESELELERKRNATTFHGSRYDLVKVKGELKIQNRLGKNINIEITKSLSGEVIDSLPKAKDIPTAKGLKRINPRHELVWEIELKSGEKKTVTYTYEVYIRS